MVSELIEINNIIKFYILFKKILKLVLKSAVIYLILLLLFIINILF